MTFRTDGLYDTIERETQKAILITVDDMVAWIPKSCILVHDRTEGYIEVIDTFEIQWKHESSLGASKPNDRSIKVTAENINTLWEYL